MESNPSTSEPDGNVIEYDVEIACVDCGGGFTWTAGEQRFYAEKNFSPPRRCRPCRAAQREHAQPGRTRWQPPENR